MLPQLTPEAFQSSTYPRTYGISLGWKLFLLGFGALSALGGITGATFLVSSPPHNPAGAIWGNLFSTVFCVGFVGLGVYVVLSALMYRVVLAEDSVELLQPLRARRLSCAEIQGRRIVRNQQGPRILVLVPKDPAIKKLKISLMLKTDRTFDAWVARLQDLDQQELDQSEQKIAATMYQHLTPQERQVRIKRHKKFAGWVNWTSLGLAVGAYILPDYHHLLLGIVMAAPWIAIGLVAAFQPLYRFGGKRNDAHPDLTQALFLPGVLLMAKALADAHTLDWWGASMLAIGGAVLVSGAALWVDPWLRQQRWSAVVLCFITLAYGLGAGFEIDVLADSSQPTIYPTRVLAMRINHGSKSTSYYLTVAPWGPLTRNHETSVSPGRYRATRIGDTICVFAGKGALDVPWYQLRDCPVPNP